MKSVAFIPARSGSKRLPNKNIALLNGHPMIAYAIKSAIDSKIFDAVICATDSNLYADIAKYYGAEVPFLRSPDISSDKSPDIEWVLWMLRALKLQGRDFDIFSILRPTSPFRSVEMIHRAWHLFTQNPRADSLRAVEKCKQHPGKMWIIRNGSMLPLMPFDNESTPWHSCQYAALPEIYVQNASLEIARSKIVLQTNTISGELVIPLIANGLEGFDINEPDDWILAQHHLASGQVALPLISESRYIFDNRIDIIDRYNL
jgi:CMP-N,N'-diacetyllegionaminic acid synthase